MAIPKTANFYGPPKLRVDWQDPPSNVLSEKSVVRRVDFDMAILHCVFFVTRSKVTQWRLAQRASELLHKSVSKSQFESGKLSVYFPELRSTLRRHTEGFGRVS